MLKLLGIEDSVGSAKLDLVAYAGEPNALPEDPAAVLGFVHAKVSLAERVSDDVPTSRAIMNAGFLSILVTLDVKSFPKSPTVSERRAYINDGELGTSAKPTDKRVYIEENGEFDLCVSFNHRTAETEGTPPSGKHIRVIRDPAAPDPLVEILVQSP